MPCDPSGLRAEPQHGATNSKHGLSAQAWQQQDIRAQSFGLQGLQQGFAQ
jgi:hypothetical protein